MTGVFDLRSVGWKSVFVHCPCTVYSALLSPKIIKWILCKLLGKHADSLWPVFQIPGHIYGQKLPRANSMILFLYFFIPMKKLVQNACYLVVHFGNMMFLSLSLLSIFTFRKFTEAQSNEEQSTQQTVWLLQEVPWSNLF